MSMKNNRFMDDDILSDDLREYGPNIMTLQAEDGRNVDFEFLDLIEYGGESYVVLLPIDEGGRRRTRQSSDPENRYKRGFR